MTPLVVQPEIECSRERSDRCVTDVRRPVHADGMMRSLTLDTRSLRAPVEARCARPDRLMRRACSRAAGRARSLDVCLDLGGPFIDAFDPSPRTPPSECGILRK
jgi:hypothetical protein